MECFVQLVKVDEERRLIHGRAVQEVPDRAREILDYESAKPAFLEWSKACEDATAGLSKGNVRVMHGKSVAGKVVDMAFNDDEKAIDIIVKVVDDNEWRKCLEGCYAGFSVGGSYAKKWQDGEFTRYTPRVTEVSLVDRPCIPTAKFFSIHKADGSVEEREFAIDDASRMTDADRLRAIAALAGGMMPNSPDAAMPVPEQMTDTRETAQPKPVDISAVEKVAPSLFGDLYKADGRKGRDGDGDGKLNEGKTAATVAATVGGAMIGALMAPHPEVVTVARRGLDGFHGAVLGYKARNDVRDFKTRRLANGPSSAPSRLRTALERTIGGAKAGVAAGKAMDATAQKTFDEGVRAQSRMRIGPIAMAPGDGEKVRHAFAARSFMQSRAKGPQLAALLAGGAAGAGIGYAMSKAAPVMFSDLYKADWDESKHPRDDSGRFTGVGMGVAAVGGALVGGALTAAALRTGRGQAAMSAARASMGPITRAVDSVSRDTAAAWRVASKTAAGQFVGNQYKNFRSLPRLVQAGAVGTALAVTPGGDKLMGLIGLDPNFEFTNGGFRVSVRAKSNGATVFSQHVKLFNEDGAPLPQQQPFQRPPLTMPQPQQAARTYEQTGSLMGQPAARPAAAQPAQAPSPAQPAAPDARAAYSERPQINPRNEAYQRLKHGVSMAIDKEAYFKGDGDLAWAKNVEQIDDAARKSRDINYAEAQDVVNKIRFSMWTKPSGAKGDYDDLKDHIEVRHSPGRDGKSDYEGDNGDLYRKADKALVRYAPHLSRPQKDALYAFIDSKRIPPDYDMIKAATFGDLFKVWDEPTTLLFGDLFKADWEESKHPRDGDGQFADVPGKGNASDPFHDGRGYSVAAKKRSHEAAVKVGKPDTREYAEAYHKAMIQEDPKYRSEHTQVIEERRGRDVWPIMAAKATSWAAFGGGAALGAALPNKRVGQAAGALFGGMYGAARGAVGGVVNPTRSFKLAGRNVTIGGKDWASRLMAGAAGTAHGAVSGAVNGARAATRSTKWNRAANAGIAANAVGWGVYFGVQPPVHFLGNVNDAARGGARRVEK